MTVLYFLLISEFAAEGHDMDEAVCGRSALPHHGQVVTRTLRGVRRDRGGGGHHRQEHRQVPGLRLCKYSTYCHTCHKLKLQQILYKSPLKSSNIFILVRARDTCPQLISCFNACLAFSISQAFVWKYACV